MEEAGDEEAGDINPAAEIICFCFVHRTPLSALIAQKALESHRLHIHTFFMTYKPDRKFQDNEQTSVHVWE